MKYFLEYMPQGLAFDITEPIVTLFLISCIVVVTLLAGLYPAFILSSNKPAAALRNIVNSNNATTRSAFIWKGLTVFQFSFSQILIVGTITIVFQLDFMLNKDLGFNPHAVVSIYTPREEEDDKRLPFKNELEQIPEIEAAWNN